MKRLLLVVLLVIGWTLVSTPHRSWGLQTAAELSRKDSGYVGGDDDEPGKGVPRTQASPVSQHPQSWVADRIQEESKQGVAATSHERPIVVWLRQLKILITRQR